MSDKKALQPRPRLAWIMSRLGWAALALWPGMTVLQLSRVGSRRIGGSPNPGQHLGWRSASVWPAHARRHSLRAGLGRLLDLAPRRLVPPARRGGTMSLLRWIACFAVCLSCGEAARWGLENWGMLGHLPGLSTGAALLLWIIPRPARGDC